jgi:hypothetical protein
MSLCLAAEARAAGHPPLRVRQQVAAAAAAAAAAVAAVVAEVAAVAEVAEVAAVAAGRTHILQQNGLASAILPY